MGKVQEDSRPEHLREYPVPTEPTPDLAQLKAWTYDGVCEATDGCMVEPDGVCEHQHVAWLRYLGYV